MALGPANTKESTPRVPIRSCVADLRTTAAPTPKRIVGDSSASSSGPARENRRDHFRRISELMTESSSAGCRRPAVQCPWPSLSPGRPFSRSGLGRAERRFWQHPRRLSAFRAACLWPSPFSYRAGPVRQLSCPKPGIGGSWTCGEPKRRVFGQAAQVSRLCGHLKAQNLANLPTHRPAC